MMKLAIHWAQAAMARALARMWLGKISEQTTHASGPHEAANPMTKTLAATSATGPQRCGSERSLPGVPTAKPNESAMAASETAMTADPVSRIGRRPTWSTSRIAMIVATTFTAPEMTE